MYKVKLLKEIALGDGTHRQPGDEMEGPDVYHLVQAGYAEPANNNARRRLEIDNETKRLKGLMAKQHEREKQENVARAEEIATQNKNARFAERLGVEVEQPTTPPEEITPEPEEEYDDDSDGSDGDDEGCL